MAESPGLPYKVCCSSKNLEQLKAWGQKAAGLGIHDQFLGALKAINHKLTTEPLNWGDPQFQARQMGLVVCHGIHSPLQVYFAVDESRRIVYVRGFKLLPGHPLGQGE
jgi:hypothetical protein